MTKSQHATKLAIGSPYDLTRIEKNAVGLSETLRLVGVHAANVTLSFMKSETMLKATNFKEALKTNFATFITENDVLAGLFHNTLTTLLHERVIKYSVSEDDHTGFKAFAPKHYTQELFDKILADTKSKLIEAELAKLVSAIDR